MAVLNALIERPPEAVWAVLEDGHSYADWVVGTQKIHRVDEDWPAVGSCIHYEVGIGPITFDDLTTVRRVEPKHELELEARAGWLGSARISFDVRGTTRSLRSCCDFVTVACCASCPKLSSTASGGSSAADG